MQSNKLHPFCSNKICKFKEILSKVMVNEAHWFDHIYSSSHSSYTKTSPLCIHIMTVTTWVYYTWFISLKVGTRGLHEQALWISHKGLSLLSVTPPLGESPSGTLWVSSWPSHVSDISCLVSRGDYQEEKWGDPVSTRSGGLRRTPELHLQIWRQV